MPTSFKARMISRIISGDDTQYGKPDALTLIATTSSLLTNVCQAFRGVAAPVSSIIPSSIILITTTELTRLLEMTLRLLTSTICPGNRPGIPGPGRGWAPLAGLAVSCTRVEQG